MIRRSAEPAAAIKGSEPDSSSLPGIGRTQERRYSDEYRGLSD